MPPAGIVFLTFDPVSLRAKHQGPPLPLREGGTRFIQPRVVRQDGGQLAMTTVPFHPHGDAAICDALVRMAYGASLVSHCSKA